ncbi:MAG TPA: TRAP transporter small permease [Stellaceae bacterium]|jgi:TRAP-type C4-dicarboxylate transport system permease small subunit
MSLPERSAAPRRPRALQLFGPIAALCLFAMMALTFAAVVARYFLNMPIPGDSEMQSFLLGFIIFSALPLVTEMQRHIAVRSFAALLKGRALFLQRAFVLAMTGLGLGFIGYLILLQAIELQEEGTLSTFLDIPEAPFTYVFAALSGVAALVAFVLLYLFLRGRDDATATSTIEGPGPE